MPDSSEFDAVPVFRALGCRTRYGIFSLLAERQLCVGALADRMGISQPAVSQHLRILREAGLVEDCRCGYHVHYRMNEDSLKRIAEFLEGLKIQMGEESCGLEGSGCSERNTPFQSN